MKTSDLSAQSMAVGLFSQNAQLEAFWNAGFGEL